MPGNHFSCIWFLAVPIPVLCMYPKKHLLNCTKTGPSIAFLLLSKKCSLFLWISLMLFHSSFESSIGSMPSEPVLTEAGIKSSYKNYSPQKKKKNKKHHSPLIKIAGFEATVDNLHRLRRWIQKPLNLSLWNKNQQSLLRLYLNSTRRPNGNIAFWSYTTLYSNTTSVHAAWWAWVWEHNIPAVVLHSPPHWLLTPCAKAGWLHETHCIHTHFTHRVDLFRHVNQPICRGISLVGRMDSL